MWQNLSVFVIGLMTLLAQVAQGSDLKVAVGEWPPYLTTELKHNGVVAHLISDIFADEGYKVSITFLPWGRVYKETAQGMHDTTGVWMHKEERENDFIYSDPVLREQFVFFHLKSYAFDWNDIGDLKGLSIGGGIKYSYGTEFDQALESGMLKIQRVSTDKQNFQKLLRGRIQIYPQEINVGYSALRSSLSKADIEKVTHHPNPLLNNLSYVLFPKQFKKSEFLRSKFNKRLEIYRESGRYDEYFEAFHQGEYEK